MAAVGPCDCDCIETRAHVMLATAQITGSKAAMVEAIVKLRASAGAFKSIKEVRNELKVGDTRCDQRISPQPTRMAYTHTNS